MMKVEDARRRRWNGRRNGGEYSAVGKNLSGVGGGFGVLKHKGRLVIGQGLVDGYWAKFPHQLGQQVVYSMGLGVAE